MNGGGGGAGNPVNSSNFSCMVVVSINYEKSLWNFFQLPYRLCYIQLLACNYLVAIVTMWMVVLIKTHHLTHSYKCNSNHYSSLVKTADSPVTVPPHDFEDIICRARTMKGRLTRCSQVKLREI